MKSVTALFCFIILPAGSLASWEEWWTYDGISGPSFWGLINPQWMLCNKGRRQSPIDIEPAKMLYDPNLRSLSVDKHKVSGVLHNTGQSLVFRPETGPKMSLAVNVSGGPLAYRYQIEEIFLHYGTENSHGSEHRIQGNAYPAEIQFYGYNAELYANSSEARHKSQGLVAIAVMIQTSDTPNPELRMLSSVFGQVIYRGQSADLRHISIHGLLPETDHYMTYEGSTTHPGCWETTTWIIFNKPIYITRQELYALRRLVQGDSETPKGTLGNNVRALQPLHHRTVRTNIDFTNAMDRGCVSMKPDMSYKANTWSTT